MKKLNSFITISLVLFFSILFTSCEDETETENGMTSNTVVDVASSNPDFSILVEALKKAGLDDDLDNSSANFTVFAPTNAAFTSLLTELGASSLNDIPTATLTNVLLYHVLSGKSTAAQISTGYYSTLSAGPAEGSKLSLYVDKTALKINGRAAIKNTDIMADNGVIHVIDKVLLPTTVVEVAQQNDQFSTLVLAVIKADLATTLSGAGPFTVFAPTNDAFKALFTALNVSGIDALSKEALTPILLAHVVSGNIQSGSLASGSVPTLNSKKSLNVVVSGSNVTIDGSVNVIKADIQAKNGVVHVINKVIVP